MRVFLSYRREDSAAFAGRVHDRLIPEFGREALFMDVDAVRLGANFVQVLSEEVTKCDVLLAIIGPNWFDAHDDEGNRRLDNQKDFVRIEIGTALQRSIPVIPILFDGAKIPKADKLPADLEDLTNRNALNVRNATFHSDIAPLIRELKGLSNKVRLTAARPAQSVQIQRAFRAEGFWRLLRSELRPLVVGLVAGLVLGLAGFALLALVSDTLGLYLPNSMRFISISLAGSAILAASFMLYLRQRLFEISAWIAYTLTAYLAWSLGGSFVINQGNDTVILFAFVLSLAMAIGFAVLRIRHRARTTPSE